jgi:adenylate kinase
MSACYSSLDLVLLGPPGSGKGTQAAMLSGTYNVPHIATGDLLREEVRAGTPVGGEVAATMARGGLVPDRLVAGVLVHRLDQDGCKRGFLLDGFPRTVEQSVLLDDLLAELGRRVERVILLDASDEVIVHRLSGRRVHPPSGRVYHVELDPPRQPDVDDVTGEPLVQRGDDREDVVRARLQVYREKTEPLVGLYEARGILVRVDADRSLRDVTDDVLAAVGATVVA